MKTTRGTHHSAGRHILNLHCTNSLRWAACLCLAGHLSAFETEPTLHPDAVQTPPANAPSSRKQSPDLEAQLREIKVPAFHVTEAPTAAVLDLAQRYIGQLSARELPPFVLHLEPAVLCRCITVQADATDAFGLLKEIASASGAELHLGGGSIDFSATAGGLAQATPAATSP